MKTHLNISGNMEIHERDGVVWLTFPAFEKSGIVTHLFSTRLGGVSDGCLSTMNLSYTRGDKKQNVDENFRRIADVMGRDVSQLVLTHQTHTANVRHVTGEDGGKGILRERGYTDVDGLVTDEPGITLGAFFADCVPVYFVDPAKKAIGLCHSGWRGTVGMIGEKVVREMKTLFGSDPDNILAAIGPSICQSCYEVSHDVAEQFRKAFLLEDNDRMLTARGGGKYLLDLWEANRRVLLRAGVRSDHISVAGICTCCHPDILFSHRASHGKRGNLAAFISLNP